MGDLSDLTRHKVSDLRSRWEAMVGAFDDILGDVETIESQRDSLRREIEHWKRDGEQARKLVGEAQATAAAAAERMSGLEEALQFILVSHQGGLTRLSPAVAAMVEALCAEIHDRRAAAAAGRDAPTPGLLLVSE